jgi:hypothetical protein
MYNSCIIAKSFLYKFYEHEGSRSTCTPLCQPDHCRSGFFLLFVPIGIGIGINIGIGIVSPLSDSQNIDWIIFNLKNYWKNL